LALSDAQAQIQGALAIAKGPGAAATFARLPVGAVEDVIGSMQAGSPLHALFASIATDAPGIAEREIATGLALGQGPQVVADAIARAINVSATRAMLIARTELNRAYRGAALAQYRQAAADGIGDSWVWSASLSASSCPACIFNSGRRFPVETPFESHPACRCTPIFEVKGLPPLIKEGSGEEYFNGLDPAQQDRILGSAAAGDAFRAGQVSLGDFVQYRENPVWGNSYQAGSLRSALANASGGRKAA
jgi:hypothetical protein